MPHPTASSRLIELAVITGAHGVAGEVRLKLFGEGADALLRIARFNAGALTLKKVRPDNKGGAIACFAEVSDRSAAQALRGTVLSAPRAALPPLAQGEYYHADLIGLVAVSDSGERVGEVIAVHNFGASDIVEIRREPVPAKGMKSFMVPLTRAAVPEWDAQRLVISRDFVEE